MSDLLYAFGIGIAFSCGIAAGAFLCSIATRRGRENLSKETLAHCNRVEDRLASYVAYTERIAVALETISKRP